MDSLVLPNQGNIKVWMIKIRKQNNYPRSKVFIWTSLNWCSQIYMIWENTALYNIKKNNISIKEQSKNMNWVPGNNIIFMIKTEP